MRMRRLVSTVTVCLAFFMFSSGCATNESAAWKTLQEDTYKNTFSYDTGSVEHTPANTVKVMASSNGAKYLYEIDCKAKKMRILSDRGVEPSQWLNIVGRSGDQLLYDAVCP